MFKRRKPPKHILFIGEESETRDYIIDIIKESTYDEKEKTPNYTFTTEDPDFDKDIRSDLLKRTDGCIFLVNSTKSSELSNIKEFLWEMFIWHPDSTNIPVVIALYNAEKAIALTSSEIIEAFSLIRLTDRLWNVMEIKENKKEDILACFNWLDEYIEVLGIKPKTIRKKSKKGKAKSSN